MRVFLAKRCSQKSARSGQQTNALSLLQHESSAISRIDNLTHYSFA
jgi:hypothetical protein